MKHVYFFTRPYTREPHTHSIFYNPVAMPTSFYIPFIVVPQKRKISTQLYPNARHWEEYSIVAEPSVMQIESSLLICSSGQRKSFHEAQKLTVSGDDFLDDTWKKIISSPAMM